MYFKKIYFTLSLAMLFVVLWDQKNVPKTASRLTKQPEDNGSDFSRIASAIRNWTVMLLFALFLWPVVLIMELSGEKK